MIESKTIIDMEKTGNNLRKYAYENGYSVRDIQQYLGLSCPQPIYRWFKGAILPSVDNLYALGKLFEVPMDQILIPVTTKVHRFGEQQAESCCSSLLNPDLFLLYVFLYPLSLNRQFNSGREKWIFRL